jgi:hypothetical protein
VRAVRRCAGGRPIQIPGVESIASLTLDPFRLLLISLAGWLNRHQRDVIDYVEEENRV